MVQHSKEIKGRTALITGASKLGDIGAAIAQCYAAQGANVIIAARSQDGLDEVAGKCRDMGGGGWVKTARCDLTDPSSMEDLAAMVSKEHGGLDVLVANAGMLKGGEMLDSDCDDWDLMMKVNLMAPMRLTRLFAPDMIKKGEGTIIFTGSLAGYRPTSMVAYSASKYGVKGWAMSCNESLHQHGISVTVIEPGFVDTPMVKDAPGNHDLFLKPSDIAEAALLPFKFSKAVPTEIVLRLVRPPQ